MTEKILTVGQLKAALAPWSDDAEVWVGVDLLTLRPAVDTETMGPDSKGAGDGFLVRSQEPDGSVVTLDQATYDRLVEGKKHAERVHALERQRAERFEEAHQELARIAKIPEVEARKGIGEGVWPVADAVASFVNDSVITIKTIRSEGAGVTPDRILTMQDVEQATEKAVLEVKNRCGVMPIGAPTGWIAEAFYRAIAANLELPLPSEVDFGDGLTQGEKDVCAAAFDAISRARAGRGTPWPVDPQVVKEAIEEKGRLKNNLDPIVKLLGEVRFSSESIQDCVRRLVFLYKKDTAEERKKLDGIDWSRAPSGEQLATQYVITRLHHLEVQVGALELNKAEGDKAIEENEKLTKFGCRAVRILRTLELELRDHDHPTIDARDRTILLSDIDSTLYAYGVLGVIPERVDTEEPRG